MNIILLALIGVTQPPFYDQAGFGGGTLSGPILMNGTFSADFASPIWGFDRNNLIKGDVASDTAAGYTRIFAEGAYAAATGGNVVGGSLLLAGGVGTRSIVMTAASCGGDNIIYADDLSVDHTCTENGANAAGTFDCTGETDAVCATNLATCLTAFTGITASANSPTSGTVYVQRAESEPASGVIGLLPSDGACFAVNQRIDGGIYASGGLYVTLTDGYWASNVTLTDFSTGGGRHYLASGQTITTAYGTQLLANAFTGVAGGAAETLTNPGTLYIEGPPTGTNITFTNGPYALFIDAGILRADGGIDLNTSTITNADDVTSTNAGGFKLENSAASDTVPTLIPSRSSLTAGIGASGANRVDIISNGADMLFVTTNSVVATATAATVDLRGSVLNSTASTALTVGDDIQQTGMTAQVAATITVDGATTFVATRNVHTLDCTGAETISTITRSAGVTGSGMLCIRFIDAECTITDTDDGAANTIDLDETDAVAGNIVSADDKTLCLIHDGTSWFQAGKISTN